VLFVVGYIVRICTCFHVDDNNIIQFLRLDIASTLTSCAGDKMWIFYGVLDRIAP